MTPACETYLRNGAGAPVYAGNSNINGYNYNIAASTFSNNLYNVQQTQLAQGLTLASARTANSPGRSLPATTPI